MYASALLNDNTPLTRDDFARVLRTTGDDTLPLLPLLHDAYAVRHAHFGRQVRIHVLDNVQNGLCPED